MRSNRRKWFDQGYDAFRTAFPEAAAAVGYAPFYLCPLCLQFLDESALSRGLLSREHVPPRSVGGRQIVLTCDRCNSKAGAEMDDDLRREADLIAFLSGKGEVSQRPAVLKTPSGGVPIRLTAKNREIVVVVSRGAAKPGESQAVESDFSNASGGAWEGFDFHIQFDPYSHARAEASWLRSAYLAFFATLGYRFILRKELDIVRERLATPDLRTKRFRIVRPEPIPEPMLVMIRRPEEFRSYAMLYGHYVVQLPAYQDRTLYDRLDAHPSGEVSMTADGQFPWPTGPIFLHDVPETKTYAPVRITLRQNSSS
jgi:HNH endonuclease